MKKYYSFFNRVAVLCAFVIIGLFAGDMQADARTENNAVTGKKVMPAQPGNNIADNFRLKKPSLMKPAGSDLFFTENKGQVTDQNGKARNDIQYKLAAANGLNIFVGNGAIHYQFSKCENQAEIDNWMTKHADNTAGDMMPAMVMDMYRMDVELVGANKNAKVITEQKQAYYENYITPAVGEKGATAHSYKRVIYKDIYPNIDWVLYTSGAKMKHEFVVHEGGNAGDIKLKYGGATGLKVNNDGSLEAKTPQGTITEETPYTYQKNDNKKITSGFRLEGDILSYTIGEHSGELVIDPSINWGTYYGSSGGEQGYGVATDGSGNVYIAGVTTSTTAIATGGAYQTTYGGTIDAFLAKFNSSGTIQWATYYGGSGNDQGFGVATDGSGNVYISGLTLSASAIATGGAHQTTLSGVQDAFLAKFNSSGAIQWATYYGGSADEQGVLMATDGSGNVYLTGPTASTTSIATGGAYQTTLGGGNDAFLVKFNSAGVRQWATYYGGIGSDRGQGVATDGSGNVYITGITTSTTAIATGGAHQATLGGGTFDAFLVKFNSSGARQWATYYGGTGTDEGRGVTADGSGNVYLTGPTTSTTGIATGGAYQTTRGGGNDAFLAKFNSSGTRQWATYYGGSNSDQGYGVATDGSGNVYITGQTNSTTAIATGGAYQATFGGTQDAFLAQFNSSGAIQWATYYGGASTELGYGVATDGSGNVYMPGYTGSTSAIATGGAYQTTYGGGVDAYLASFSFGIANATPAFTGGGTQALNVCQNSSSNPINSLLEVSDADAAQTLTWTVTSGPANGSLSGVASYTATSTGGTITPTGMTYTPTGGYTGTDAFTIEISDGIATASTTINVTVNPSPAAITGTQALPAGTISTLASTTSGGTWSSASTAVGTIGSLSGVVTGLTAGTTVISYTAGGCSATAIVTVNSLTTFVWYLSAGGGNASSLANWWSSNNTTGYQPTSFSTPTTTWTCQGTVTSTGALTFAGDVTIPPGSTFTPFAGSTTTVGGNWNNTGGTFTHNGGTILFDGSNGSSSYTLSGSMTGANRFNNVTFNAPGITYSFGANAADADGDFVHSAGTVTAPSTTLSVGGNFNHTAGNFNPNGGTVIINGGTSTLTVTGMTTAGTNCFHHLSFNASSASTYTISANLLLTGNFNNMTANGTVALGTNTMTVGGTWNNAGPFVTGAKFLRFDAHSQINMHGKL